MQTVLISAGLRKYSISVLASNISLHSQNVVIYDYKVPKIILIILIS